MFLEHPARLTANYWTSEKKVYTRIRYNLSPYCLTLETTSLCVWQIQSHWHQTIEANVAVGFLYNMNVCTEAKPLTLCQTLKSTSVGWLLQDLTGAHQQRIWLVNVDGSVWISWFSIIQSYSFTRWDSVDLPCTYTPCTTAGHTARGPGRLKLLVLYS